MAKPPVIESFLIADAAKLSGLSRVMLDYLCREEVLIPSFRGARGRGKARKYSFADVVMLRVLAQFLKAGVSVRRLKKALQMVRRDYQSISRSSLPAQYLVSDGTRIYWKGEDGIFDLDGSGQRSFLFVLELEQVRNDVVRKAAAG